MAVGYSRIDRDIAFTLERKSPKIFENIFLQNGCLVLLGSKGRVKTVTGGNRFDERTHLGQNANVDHRDKYAEISTNYSDTWKTAYYGQDRPLLVERPIEKAIKFKETLASSVEGNLERSLLGTCRDYNIATCVG